jgi:exopolyphosphatase/pppGpp-phosphohydrolase
MKLSEISMVDSIGNNRADTITAGSHVVKQLMEKLEFDGVDTKQLTIINCQRGY